MKAIVDADMETVTRSALLAGFLAVFLTPLDAGEPFATPLEDRSNNGDREFTLGVFGWFTAVDGEAGSAGVALIGAAVTAYILGVLLDNQQKNAAKWRAEIRTKIDQLGR